MVRSVIPFGVPEVCARSPWLLGFYARSEGFLDLRTAIRAASVRDILHGPRDFKHFNRKGMETLGPAVAEWVNRSLTQEVCSESPN